MGLYLKWSIVLFYIPIIAIYLIIKELWKIQQKKNNTIEFRLWSMKRYFRYVKLIINTKIIFSIIIFSTISNSIVIFQNKRYENRYQDGEIITGEAIVISELQEKEYYNRYKIQYENTFLYLKLDKKSTENLEYGDKIKFSGQFIEPSTQRNEGGFNNKQYLKTIKIYGSIKVEKVELIARNQANPIFQLTNKISLSIKQKIDLFMRKEEASILKGILFGEGEEITDDMQENFRISNISHVLAVSGMHINYVIIGIHLLLQSRIGKKRTRIITIIFLGLYTVVTGFSPSVVRASIMAILLIGAGILHRKSDIWSSISLSLLIILLYNPFLIMNIGLQFSYLGTIGIILFHENVLSFLKNIKIRNRKWKYIFSRKIIKIGTKIKEILAVTISAQLAILPVMIYHFNLFGTYFILTNLLVSIIVGPIIILGSITVGISFFINPIAKIIGSILAILIQILITISNLSHLPFAKIYIPTPQIYSIILYYLFILIFNIIYHIYIQKKLNNTQRRVRNLIALVKYKLFQNKKKYFKIIVLLVFIIFFSLSIPKKLEIHFVDVGQGDCTFIVTPKNETILIDGGGSTSKEYDVGKSVLLPYILDQGYTKIDYIFISHFDQDHTGGILTILEELKVKKVFIAKQEEDSENYQKFLKIVKEKRISVNVVKRGDRVKIEKNFYFDILWPGEQQIEENILNNNSAVMKMCYQNFSILFTGDIEKQAEEKILEIYEGKEKKLKANILKVAHHGSKTSTIEEFLKCVSPKIAIIGVGKNNLFKHPSEETIEKLREYDVATYRTDENGEITITVDKNGKFLIKSIYKK